MADKQVFSVPVGYAKPRIIGQGALGLVAQVRNQSTGNVEAMKRLRLDRIIPPQQIQRFYREIELLQRLDHPHLVAQRDFGVDAVGPWFSMELCEGGNLEQWQQSQKEPVRIDVALNIIVSVLNALDYLHHVTLSDTVEAVRHGRSFQGIVHRDLKPANILFADAACQVVKVGDFGLAKAFEAAGLSGLTASSAMGGTYEYMPRMQAIDFLNAGPAVDLWAAVAVLFRLLTGEPPRPFSPLRPPVQVLRECDVRPVRMLNPQVPPPVAAVIDEVLAGDLVPSRLTVATVEGEFRESLRKVG